MNVIAQETGPVRARMDLNADSLSRPHREGKLWCAHLTMCKAGHRSGSIARGGLCESHGGGWFCIDSQRQRVY
jgi:hypothetical protein